MLSMQVYFILAVSLYLLQLGNLFVFLFRPHRTDFNAEYVGRVIILCVVDMLITSQSFLMAFPRNHSGEEAAESLSCCFEAHRE